MIGALKVVFWSSGLRVEISALGGIIMVWVRFGHPRQEIRPKDSSLAEIDWQWTITSSPLSSFIIISEFK